MTSLGVMIAGGNGNRRENDFYPTPREATIALLPLIADWPKTIWEPACGDGAMARVLRASGRDVVATDLIHRGFGQILDFLGPTALQIARPQRKVIITNPPFKLAAQFIERADELGAAHLALLLKASFWNAASRLKTWDRWAPYARRDLTWRLDFDGRGAPTMDCAWFLWDRTSPPLARPLVKPAPISAEEMLA